LTWLPLGSAVHAGPAFVGNFGSGGVVDFTAVGDTVNTTARLQGPAAAGEIVLSDVVFASVAAQYPGAAAANPDYLASSRLYSLRSDSRVSLLKPDRYAAVIIPAIHWHDAFVADFGPTACPAWPGF
jgi:class 3 adenylate cyclase